ncbi:MAG: hybrid sensor histidine kinase/response regulator [Proteobacteria bacterium]|nr:hybrid sensor histidine kinase/response regulator [Pseudomonadota bacterium]
MQIAHAPILVVDDSATIRAAVSFALRQAGFAVLQARSGMEALTTLQGTEVSLVITDQIMDGMEGTELCKKIRADTRYASLPIISLTGLSDKEAIRSIYASGVSDYVRKPFIPEELLARVKVHLERYELLQELEQRVQERTTELAQTNTALRTEIQERKNAMVALEAAKEKAEQASLVKSRFLANMSHELRTPLNGVMGFSRLALECAPQGEMLSHLSLIRNSAESMLHVINDILEFSRLETGHTELQQRPFEPLALLKELEDFFSAECITQDKTLVCRAAGNIPSSLVGDPFRLKQIFIQLIGNALKFTPKGAGIVVSVEPLARHADTVTLACAVSDSGIGIPAEVLPRIFEPFTQADTSDTRQYGGTGLGLTTTAQLIRLMGGTIEVKSLVGIGSSFRFTVHFKTQDEAAHPTTEVFIVEDELQVDGCILVAEDNPVSQKLLLSLIQKRGLHGIAAANGAEAVKLVTETPIVAVLMDCQMPVLDGYEATRQIRALSDPLKRSIPIIAVTASALDGDVEKCLAAGMNALVPKPVSPTLLFETLGKLLTRTGAESQIQRNWYHRASSTRVK